MALKDRKKRSRWQNRHFYQAVIHAMAGLVTVYQEERNFRFHCWSALVVLVLTTYLRLSWQEGLWLLLAIFMVLGAEILNSTIENIVDLATGDHYHPLAKKAKDMAAGLVLLTAWLATIIGIVILGPKLMQIL